MEPQVILKRFNNNTTRQDRTLGTAKHGDDKAKQLRQSLHSLQVQNELLHHENNGLQSALCVKQNHKKKSYPLDLQQPEEHYGGAVFWSPSKIYDARAREATKQHHAELQQLQ
ncbi:hypothetical protein P3342_004641 [Pyrenophora teres f. teres]|nr:hypothetical protein P3342_004641 [Pyrenophora teres f. teres]